MHDLARQMTESDVCRVTYSQSSSSTACAISGMTPISIEQKTYFMIAYVYVDFNKQCGVEVKYECNVNIMTFIEKFLPENAAMIANTTATQPDIERAQNFRLGATRLADWPYVNGSGQIVRKLRSIFKTHITFGRNTEAYNSMVLR